MEVISYYVIRIIVTNIYITTCKKKHNPSRHFKVYSVMQFFMIKKNEYLNIIKNKYLANSLLNLHKN